MPTTVTDIGPLRAFGHSNGPTRLDVTRAAGSYHVAAEAVLVTIDFGFRLRPKALSPNAAAGLPGNSVGTRRANLGVDGWSSAARPQCRPQYPEAGLTSARRFRTCRSGPGAPTRSGSSRLMQSVHNLLREPSLWLKGLHEPTISVLPLPPVPLVDHLHPTGLLLRALTMWEPKRFLLQTTSGPG